jgi:beta-N-acetylglucosaminidase
MKRRELVAAHMNGYYRALQLDIEEINKLQSDKGVLTNKVKTA